MAGTSRVLIPTGTVLRWRTCCYACEGYTVKRCLVGGMVSYLVLLDCLLACETCGHSYRLDLRTDDVIDRKTLAPIRGQFNIEVVEG